MIDAAKRPPSLPTKSCPEKDKKKTHTSQTIPAEDIAKQTAYSATRMAAV